MEKISLIIPYRAKDEEEQYPAHALDVLTEPQANRDLISAKEWRSNSTSGTRRRTRSPQWLDRRPHRERPEWRRWSASGFPAALRASLEPDRAFVGRGWPRSCCRK